MSDDYLATCKTAFACSLNEELPNEGYSFATFVELKLKIQGMIVTVGNESRPPYNTACITSLQYGSSQGMGAVIEITDEEGGTFSKSFEALNKGLGNLGKELESFQLDFGWIVTPKCNEESSSSVKKISAYTETGSYVQLVPFKMNVSYGQGVIKYTLECNDNLMRVAEGKVEASVGRDDAKVPLKQAIRQFMKEKLPPPMIDVEFMSADDPKKEFDFKNSEGGKEGPKSVWLSMQQNKLATLRRWIAPLRTSNDKGIIIEYERTGKIILRENPIPDKCGETNRCPLSHGTYIVNGGKNSPVIEFSPEINWTLAMNGGTGGSSSPASGAAAKKEGLVCGGEPNKNDSVGTATHSSTAGTENFFAPDGAAVRVERAGTGHEIALGILEGATPISAELTVVGDPRIIFPDQIMGYVISIIVINPFHLKSSSAAGCPEWLASPVCNAALSNRFWDVTGVDHQISAGSYKTTYKVTLPVPNVQLDLNDPIGGVGSGGPTLDIKTAPRQK